MDAARITVAFHQVPLKILQWSLNGAKTYLNFSV